MKVRCTECQGVRELGELRSVQGQKIKKPGEEGFWQQVLYYCPCNEKLVKAFDPGDGRVIITDFSKCQLVDQVL